MAITKQELDSITTKLETGDYKCYFFLPDFDKHSGGIQYVYNHVLRMREEGYNAIILHQKTGYRPEWLADWFETDDDGKFVDFEVQYLDAENLRINMEDFFFIPEGFPELMENLKNATCKKIVFCLNWFYVLNALKPGTFWDSYGITDCMSITQSQTEYLKMIMPFLNIKNVVGQIDNTVYTPPERVSDKRMQMAFIPSRDGGAKAHNVIKTFYALFPHLRFINFIELKGMDKDQFASAMRESQFYVHFDEHSSMGTAPLEAWLSDCLVAGWDGVGGREFMSDKNTWLAPNGDVVRLALAMGHMVETHLTDGVTDEMKADIREQCERYTVETERASVIEAHAAWKAERIEQIKKLRKIAIDESEVVELPVTEVE